MPMGVNPTKRRLPVTKDDLFVVRVIREELEGPAIFKRAQCRVLWSETYLRTLRGWSLTLNERSPVSCRTISSS